MDDSLLAIEATAALMSFAHQPAALVAGCRRVLARQPLCGPLWWSCARILTAEDVWAVAQEVISQLEDDPTDAALEYALGGTEDPGRDEHGHDNYDNYDDLGFDDLDGTATGPAVMRARAMGGGQVAVSTWHEIRGERGSPPDQGSGMASGSDTASRVGQSWLVIPVGAHLSDPMWDALRSNVERSGDRAGRHPQDRVQFRDLSEFSHFVGPYGLLPMVALEESDCPVAPELFRLDG